MQRGRDGRACMFVGGGLSSYLFVLAEYKYI
jgi:hypothetical protein